jgi:hypothetical protein
MVGGACTVGSRFSRSESRFSRSATSSSSSPGIVGKLGGQLPGTVGQAPIAAMGITCGELVVFQQSGRIGDGMIAIAGMPAKELSGDRLVDQMVARFRIGNEPDSLSEDRAKIC